MPVVALVVVLAVSVSIVDAVVTFPVMGRRAGAALTDDGLSAGASLHEAAGSHGGAKDREDQEGDPSPQDHHASPTGRGGSDGTAG